MVPLLHEGRILKVFFAFKFSLNPGIIDSAYFFRVESFPLLSVELLVELFNLLYVNKINESIPDVALVDQIDRKIEKVKLSTEVFIDQLKHLLLRILVRDIPDHQGSPVFLFDSLQVNLVLFVILYSILLPLRPLLGLEFLGLSVSLQQRNFGSLGSFFFGVPSVFLRVLS